MDLFEQPRVCVPKPLRGAQVIASHLACIACCMTVPACTVRDADALHVNPCEA